MKTILFASMMLTLLVISEKSLGINFMWLTNWETSATFPGDVVRFFGRDTLWGPVHSNDWIATQNVGGLPVFYGSVSTTKPSFRAGSPNPAGWFFGGAPQFNAPPVRFPETLEYIREAAIESNTFMSIDGQEWYASIRGDSLVCYYWPEGTMLDTAYHSFITLDLEHISHVFFDGKVDVRGELNADDIMLVIGCNHDIRIVDNVIIEGTDPTTGLLPDGATSAICLASERWVVVGNTWENGRENRAQGADVVVTALIFALRGSFQIEQMNDVLDPYISPVTPDERGNLVVNGGITQFRRGYLHRSNRGGTGYNRILRYDTRLRDWNPGIDGPVSYGPDQDSLIFDDTPVGTAVIDTFRFFAMGAFSGALATYPFYTNAPYQNGGMVDIPVRFTPPSVGPWSGNLTFFVAGAYRNVVLYGRGIPAGGPQIVETEIYPNPFNNTSTFRFTLPEETNVRALVYDVLGREVAQLADGHFASGEHTLQINAASWSSGVYFMTFQSGESFSTHKLLLLK